MYDKELLLKACEETIFQNEVGGNRNLAYKFSDPDGLRTGKSGYSFGCSQFDIKNNNDAVLFLLNECGFTEADITVLQEQRRDISHLEQKLFYCKDLVDEADRKHMAHSIDIVESRLESCNYDIDHETFVHLVDYHNQFYISRNGKMHRFMQKCDHLDPQDILTFKLHNTLWGRKRPDDVKRRFNTIHSYFTNLSA